MNARIRNQILAAVVAGTALFAAGCSDRPGETVGQKVDNTTAKVAAATERAADKTAAVLQHALGSR